MALPKFNADGDLPPGVYRATMEVVVARFGGPCEARQRCTVNLKYIYELAKSTGHLDRFVVFGSYVTDKPAPNDVDVLLVMNDAFHVDEAPLAAQGLFDHSVAQLRFGASVFWIKPRMAIGEPLNDFMGHWQHKRNDTLRGIVEIVQ